MAFCQAFRASASPPIGPKKIPQISKNNNAGVTSIPPTQKWSITQDHTLVSTPSKPFHPLTTARPSVSDESHVEHAQKLKEVKHVLREIRDVDALEDLVKIDTIQRLAIDYHFQDEIEAVLQRQYVKFEAYGDEDDHDLYEVALRFRLLRQEGYNVSAKVFNSFKDKEGKFKQKLSKDIRGLLGLYEASQLSMEGEDILDEARDFTSKLLKEGLTHLTEQEATIVSNTSRYPYHKSLARFMVRNFISTLQGKNQWRHDVQELAKMDFNRVQSIHQKEVLQISKWWKDLGLAKEVKFARDQPLKWYMWSLAIFADPTLSEERIELTKPISFIYIIDDIFDVYGTLDELILFTEAVNRWDFAVVEQLPDYMKECFKALDGITNGIAHKVYKDNGWNCTNSLRKAWATLCNAFLVEAKWFASGELPKADEYLKTATISSGVHIVLVHMFYLLGEGITKETVELVDSNIPAGIMQSTAAILRLWDDLGSAKDESQDGQDGSYVECYMKEHQGCSIESAQEHTIQMISDAWKRLNQQSFSRNPFSATFANGCLNLARMVPLMYNYDDNQCLPDLEEHMTSLLYESSSL